MFLRRLGYRAIPLSGLVVLMLLAFMTMTGAAMASGGTKVCVPSKEGKPIVTPKGGVCKPGYTLTELGAEGKEGPAGKEGKEGAPGKEGKEGPEGKQGPEGKEGLSLLSKSEQEKLKAILPCIKYVEVGIGGKPTIQIVGCNLQVLSGAGKEETVNGAGNLVIGYDENNFGHEQSGSNNLVLGAEQEFTSWGGIVAGISNVVTGPYASVTGGNANTASGRASSVSGGGGGIARGFDASVSGGQEGTASGSWASVSGGFKVTAKGERASVQGGYKNLASGLASSIFGAKELTASGEYEAIP